ncbi:Uncharacterised protein [uncultured archaeon]|nr:Uncharacterised protein [uncultured archaeon]
MDLQGAWTSTCKTIFGQELGPLAEFEPYLKEALIGKEVRSAFSKKPLRVTSPHFDARARFFDYAAERPDYEKLNTPLDLNALKDIDSVVGAVKERLVYAGNKRMGQSQNVEMSDQVTDSIDIHHSALITRCQHVAYCTFMQDGEYCFGCTDITNHPTSVIRCFYNHELKRSFECSYGVSSADCLFCYNVEGCNDCLFTFSEKNKRHMIGNVQLTPDAYKRLKTKLVGEIAQELAAKKRYPLSITDML